MSVNGVTGSKGAADLYGTYNTSAKTAEKTENKKEENTNNGGVVYEPSSNRLLHSRQVKNLMLTW